MYIALRALRGPTQSASPAVTVCPDSGVEGGIEPGTPGWRLRTFMPTTRPSLTLLLRGLGGHRAKHRIQCRGRPPRASPPALRAGGDARGGRPRLKEGHAEKIDCRFCEDRFCFFQIVQGIAEPPPRPGSTCQNTPVCLYFSCLEFSKEAS